jgi:hypothetical protein
MRRGRSLMVDVKVEVVENRVAEREHAKLAPAEPHARNRHSLRIYDTEQPYLAQIP